MHEKDNYLKTAELSTEQNCNMIDGVPNNTPIPPTPPELDAKPLDKVKEPKERRGLCTENGSERVYPAHRPYARKRADLSATALFQQSQSGRRTRTHLWRVPGGNRRIEAGL